MLRVVAKVHNNKESGAMTSATKPKPLLTSGETRAYPVLPLRDIVVFPHMIVPLFVGREKSIKALEEVMRSDTFILLATQKNASDDDPATDSIYTVGTLASVLQLLKLPDGTVKVLVEGAARARHKVHRPRGVLRSRSGGDRRYHGRSGRGRSAGALGRQ
jgi:ATP-dependent Lon protease